MQRRNSISPNYALQRIVGDPVVHRILAALVYAPTVLALVNAVQATPLVDTSTANADVT
jgi:hypothetical protein